MSDRRARTPANVVAGVCACLTLGLAGAAVRSDAETGAVASWREDVRAFADSLARLHVRLFWRTPRAAFERGVDSLLAAVPRASDDAIVLELIRLGAIADAHTGVQWGDSASHFHRLPLQFARFSDGWYVVGADSAHAGALGMKLVAAGPRAIGDLAAALTPYVPHENAPWLEDRLADAFAVPEFLVHVGAAEAIDRVAFTLEDSLGQRAVVRVAPADASAPARLVAYTAAANVPTPFARQDPASNYWFRYLPDSRTLFFRYNRCAEMDSLPFAAFARRMLDTLDARPVERVVVDLRANTGGNSRVIDPFLQPILDRRDIARKDRLIVLIGRRTFSSGLLNAIQLAARGSLVGEPTGGRPNGYGETRQFRLPHSRLPVQYSTRYFDITKLCPWIKGDPESLAPDVLVPVTWDDFRHGRDAAFARAVSGRVLGAASGAPARNRGARRAP